MKTIRLIIATLLFGMNVASCDFLEKEPTYTTPENFFKSEADVASWITGTYAILGQSSFYGNEYLYLVGGDDLGHYGGANRGPYKNGLICNNAHTGDPLVAALWYTLYAGINRANVLLEQIDAVPEINDDIRRQYKAEARFLRAFYYFTLVQCWGDVPLRTTSTQEVYHLSIPRTDKQQIYTFIIKEMKQAASDLKSARELNYQPGHVSRSAAYGMLARVCLFRAGEPMRDKEVGLTNRMTTDEVTDCFRQASHYAQLVRNEGHALTADYWDFFIDICADRYNTAADKSGAKANESIWEVEFAGNRSTDVRAEGRLGNTIGIPCKDLSSKSSVTGKGDPGFSYGFIYSTPKLLDLYEANNDINRCNWNIAPFTYTQSKGEGSPIDGREFIQGKRSEVERQYWNVSYSYGKTEPGTSYGDRESKVEAGRNRNRPAAKYRREYEPDKKSKNDTSINFPLLRYSDVLLMIAEAENEVSHGPNALAYECINAVRERAGIRPLDPGMSEETFRQAVKDERAMELCFEYTRRFDLIRWGEYYQAMQEQAARAQTDGAWKLGTSVHTYFNIPKAYHYFPIPASEMGSNKAIQTNNPGW